MTTGHLVGRPGCSTARGSKAWQIRTREDISNVMLELVYPTEEKMAYQGFCLDDELVVGKATTRIEHVIESALLEKSVPVSSIRTVPGGPLTFSHIHTQVSTFSEDSKVRLQYELDGCYRHLALNHNMIEDLLKSLRKHPLIRFLNYFRKIFGIREIHLLRRIDRFLDDGNS